MNPGTERSPVQWWSENQPWATIVAGLILIAILYVQGGPAGAIGTLGLVAVALVVLAWYGRTHH